MKTIIVAKAMNNAIGKDNDLPWKLPNDMRHFKQITTGHVVIMGRKNYESIPTKFRPLPNRTNIVLTRQSNFEAPGCITYNSLEQALEYCKLFNQEEIFIIGGEDIYRQSLPIADKLIVTEVGFNFLDADRFFPEIDEAVWVESGRQFFLKDERNPYNHEFVTYIRK
ncbi:hypothetical protein AWW67_00640 [Roseivirga seohaensis]|uniref:Dihydrofolate reductase n=1 Tax=Roseivirga seohaensis TaxID=1914963 RepID=A0A150Y4I4_9BACT|nr:hypothetical protein AWW67_00640 [Roseivirga seohaensis]